MEGWTNGEMFFAKQATSCLGEMTHNADIRSSRGTSHKYRKQMLDIAWYFSLAKVAYIWTGIYACLINKSTNLYLQQIGLPLSLRSYPGNRRHSGSQYPLWNERAVQRYIPVGNSCCHFQYKWIINGIKI